MVSVAAKQQSNVRQWATFFLAGELFALPVSAVQEVLQEPPLTPVPHAPEHLIGLLNLRGQIMPVIDLRNRLGFGARDDGRRGKLLVMKTEGGPISLLVDDIGDVIELPTSDWRSPPDTLSTFHRRYVRLVCPLEKHLLMALRPELLGFDDEAEGMRGQAA